MSIKVFVPVEPAFKFYFQLLKGCLELKIGEINCCNFTNLLYFLVSEKMAQEENYCRNPDSSGSPWCYVKGETKPVKENCKIPSCGR